MQDHILDLSKKRNTTYYDQIDLIKEHTSPRDTLEKVAAVLNSKNGELSGPRDFHPHQRHGETSGIFSSTSSASSSSTQHRQAKAASSSPPRVPDAGNASVPPMLVAVANGKTNRNTEMQISPELANREGDREEQEQGENAEEPSPASETSAENDLVNVVDDEPLSGGEEEEMPLSLCKSNAS